ncbi:MAG: hypothetical protein AB2A00_28650 [Myxococcota bacterium]
MSNSALLLFITLVLVAVMWLLALRRIVVVDGANKGLAISGALTMVALFVVDSALGMSGVLGRFERVPPNVAFFMFAHFALAAGIAFSRLGTTLMQALSYRALVGFQAFRIPTEVMIALGVAEGIAPPQLSFHGYNMDLVPAVLAALLFLSGRENRKLVLAWNGLGWITLGNIFFIAMTSFPVPFRVFMNEPTNIWVTRFPYVLLPGVLVTSAVTGHLLVTRKLRAETRAPVTPHALPSSAARQPS